jgi:aspartyl-tRNA(Asn)/glutamyl-tRNA(Gln) amidotransferase subunit A
MIIAGIFDRNRDSGAAAGRALPASDPHAPRKPTIRSADTIARIRDWSALDPRAQRRRQETARTQAATLAPHLNAFVEITPAAPAGTTGPLNGLPYAAKDMFRTRAREPGCGIGFASGITGSSDLIDRLAAAGADLVGFTSMTELAYEPSGFNATLGRVRNPWNLDFISGGSSSGSAAAVAAGAVVAALGSDTGGSLRIPAHACGVTAWKPSHALVSTMGAMPLAPTLDVVGLLARSANDLLLVAPHVGLGEAVDPVRRAVVAADIAAESESAIGRCLAEAVAAIEAVGIRIERRPALTAVEHVDRHALVVMQGESARHHQSLLEGNALMPALRRRLQKGFDIADETLAASVAARDRLVREFGELVLSGSGVLVLPVMPIETPPADRCDPTSDRFSARTLYALSRWTRFVNMLGFPAVALPAGCDNNGMPVGVQIVGRPGSDRALLDLARQVQAITNWHARVPGAVAHLLPAAAV